MPALLRHPVSRFIAGTAMVGSLADWILFATLVVTVDRVLGGGPWATALVLLVRILPSALFAPLAARRVDRLALRSTLVGHEALRVTAVAGLATGFVLASVPLVLVSMLALEFGSAMQAAAREATISRHVPGRLFTGLNTVTAALAYGFLPLGPVIVGRVGASAGWLLAIAGYTALVVAYRVGLPALAPTDTSPRPAEPAHLDAPPATAGPWRRITVAASLGLVPAVALFALGPTFAEAWLGDRAATGGLYALVLGGAVLGGTAANTHRIRAEVAMLVAAAGMAVAVAGGWVPGLVLVGLGAGAAYLDLQTRLQHAASNPSEFATAFAILKVTSAAAVAGAPALASIAPLSSVLVVGAATAVVGAAVVAPAGERIARTLLRRVLGMLVRTVLRVEVAGAARRVAGPAVVVSNHPHWLDGAVALLADRTLRPVARCQSHPGGRLGIWAADAVVTGRDGRPAFAEAAATLVGGGRVWLAPEGGAHNEHRLRQPRSGAVRMAHLAGVPVQSLGIAWHDDPAGPDLARWRPWRRRVVRVTWGTPVATRGGVEGDNAAMMASLAAVTGMSLPDTTVPAPA